jgi:hypothetical protein
MLGFSPISARPISGSAFSLVAIAAAMSASLTLGFAVTGRLGAFIPMQGSIGVAFNLSPTLWVNQSLHGSISITFGGTSTLYIAGKPIRINALPESFELRAVKEQWTLKALPQSFNTRGAR